MPIFVNPPDARAAPTMPELRVNVFRASDRSPLYDARFGAGPPTPGGPDVWSLVQVFLQVAREVDGGRIRRIVFRASDGLPGPSMFGASPPRPIVEVAVAHASGYAVVVTTARSALPQLPVVVAATAAPAAGGGSDNASSATGSGGLEDTVSAASEGGEARTPEALAKRVLGFILTELRPVADDAAVSPNDTGGDGEAEPDTFDVRAYMESFVWDSDSGSSFLSTEEGTPGGSRADEESSSNASPVAAPEIDLEALAEEVESAFRGL